MRERRSIVLGLAALACIAALLVGPCAGTGDHPDGGSGDRAARPRAGAMQGDAVGKAGAPTAEMQPAREEAARLGEEPAGPSTVLRVSLHAAGSDAPLPGQAMDLRDIGGLWPWPLLASAETDEGGEARITVPAGRALMLQLKPDPDWARDFLRVEPLAEGEERAVRIDLKPQPRYAGLLALVSDEGLPVTDAEVLPLEAGVFTPARSDDGGVVRLRDLREDDRVFYRVRADGFADAFGELSPERPQATVRLRRGAQVEGRLTFADGLPAAGVTVSLRADPRKLGVSEGSLEVAWRETCRADGSFRFADLPIGIVLLAEARADATSVHRVVPGLTPGVHALDLQMGGAPRLHGRVVDEAGRPVAGVEMHAEPRLVLDEDGYGSALQGLPRRSVRTDADGRFEFAGEQALHPGRWGVGTAGSLDGSARPAASYGAAYRYLPERQEIDLAAGADAVELLFQLRGGATIRGRLVDHLGAPVRLGTVVAHPIGDRGGMGPVQTADLDADGRFVLEPLLSGVDYRLNASDPVRETWGSLSPVPVDGPEVELRLPPPPGMLRGRVVDAAGEGAYATGFGYERSAGARDAWALRIEPDGSFVHRVEEGQVFDLMVWTRDGRAALLSGVSVAPGDERSAELQLQRGARVRPAPDYSATLGVTVELLLDGAVVYTGYAMRLEESFLLPPGRLEVRTSQGDQEMRPLYLDLLPGGGGVLPFPAVD